MADEPVRVDDNPVRVDDNPATAADTASDADAEVDGDRCPSCDTPDAWRLTRRHRVSPFGAVALLALSFWAGIFGWLLGFGLTPAGVLAGLAAFLLLLRRRAEICEACGFVRPR